jgi:putative intracellular protease/amidase
LYVWDTRRGWLNLSFHEVAKACKKLDVIVTTNGHIKSIVNYEGNVKTAIPTLKSVVSGGGKKERARVDIEAHAKALLELGLDQRTGTGTVVVLCGSIGCLVATIAPAAKKGKILGKDKVVTFNWLPPAYDQIFARAARRGYWMYDWKTRTMFAGALTYAMAKGDNALLAAKKGAVAMTFLLELVYWAWKETYDRELIGISRESWEKIRKRLQFEVSLYDLQPQYINGEEFWNQSTFAERLEAFEATLECPADTQELFAFLRKHSSQRPQGTVVS